MKKNPDFSILSPIYDFLGSLMFQGSLHSSQTFFLDKLQEAKHVLILGGGTGRFLVDLLKRVKVEKVSYVDISPGMIKQAKRKVQRLGIDDQVEFICGGLELIPDDKFDLICTHYFLDCFSDDELIGVYELLKEKLSENGVWHFTDFYLDQESSSFRKAQVRFLYFFFRMSCGLKVDKLANFKSLFEESGFKEREQKFFRRKLFRSALYEAYGSR